ncbi:TetR/AcrR family transcriptional regulator C-terminal domain-containing protein [Streptomyces brasiliensis]|uniref:Tetracycline repressor, C-all-alpha domain protein n=1 Tax=Streptomyces brasiliensis TaxID=1954 RepID=A0A917L8H0_9ACTN|nr:TetR/AcrR family transcriptional regulator C-terminal domain-containing protein [Streptomyces brasiliensis]GGJ48759.1 tetracycline repressor, C-all-alpha domain protein [Streptomyces brasiliensis]
MSTGFRRSGRPTTPMLDREIIVRSALDLIDDVGAKGFSVNLLAQRLRVRPSSLYNHVKGKDDILAGVRELVAAPIDAGVFDNLPWDEALMSWARLYRAAFAAHPQTIPLLATQPLPGAHSTVRMYETVASGLERAGWPADTVVPLIVGIESFILGSALDLTAPPTMLDPGPDSPQAPRFTALVHARDEVSAAEGRPAADLAFEFSLTALVDGLRARLAEQTAASGDSRVR